VTEPAGPEADRRWLLEAISLSRRCPPSRTAYSVGAVLVAADGSALSTGYSRETAPEDHAEEVALAKAGLPAAAGGAAPELAGATLYSSLEPCAVRASRPVPCADLILASGIGRVVIAWTEPPVLAPGGGASRLRAAGVEVTEVPELAAAAREVNAQLLAQEDTVPPRDTPDAGGRTPLRCLRANGPPGRD
jgi:diaminohydroxyphosphoribosylaminopyrimidine deaminase / 5-amino-6-(5-phosphoribosylamino)uracil reductase